MTWSFLEAMQAQLEPRWRSVMMNAWRLLLRSWLWSLELIRPSLCIKPSRRAWTTCGRCLPSSNIHEPYSSAMRTPRWSSGSRPSSILKVFKSLGSNFDSRSQKVASRSKKQQFNWIKSFYQALKGKPVTCSSRFTSSVAKGSISNRIKRNRSRQTLKLGWESKYEKANTVYQKNRWRDKWIYK